MLHSRAGPTFLGDGAWKQGTELHPQLLLLPLVLAWVYPATGQYQQVCQPVTVLLSPVLTGMGGTLVLSESLYFWSLHLSKSKRKDSKGSQHVGFHAYTPPSFWHQTGPEAKGLGVVGHGPQGDLGQPGRRAHIILIVAELQSTLELQQCPRSQPN